MLRFATLLGLTAIVVASDFFPRDNYFNRYGFNKMMVSCFGPYAYKQHIEAIVAAEAQCMGETFSMDHLPQDLGPHAGYGKQLTDDFGNDLVLDFGATEEEGAENTGKTFGYAGVAPVGLGYGAAPVAVGYGHAHGAHAADGVDAHAYGHAHVGYGHGIGHLGHHLLHSGLFLGDAATLDKSLAALDGAVGNFTCVLKTLGLVGDNLEILYNNVFKSIYKSVYDPYLKQDLLAGIYQCSYELQCLPEDRVGSAYPYKLQRLLAFHKCERKARLTACLKQDLRYHFKNFDSTVLPDDNGRTGEIEKILTVLLGAETTEDLRFY